MNNSSIAAIGGGVAIVVIAIAVATFMLPGMSGLCVCQMSRENSELKNTPIIMLSAKDEERLKVWFPLVLPISS